MPKITRSPDCGHSPKNQLLEALAIARVTNDTATLDSLLTDDVTWTIVGKSPIDGKESVIDAIANSREQYVTELSIFHVTQHGKIGAVNGQLNNRSGNVVDFCDICEFANTKGTAVAAITSYIIKH